ncbi:MAG: NAD(P)H-dependent oxidoreductase [Gammaproteobacteria bacterium]
MKVLAIIGTPTREKGYTTRSVEVLEQSLRRKSDVQFEYLYLEDRNLSRCQGHLSCVKFGERQCPFHDEIAPIKAAIEAADVVIFASPVHCFNVSTLMKNLIDLFVYQMHRPQFFGKKAVVVTAAAGAGQGAVLKYLRKTARIWGFDVVAQFGTHAGLFAHENYQPKLAAAAARVADKMIAEVKRGKTGAPGLAELINFRVWRSVVARTREASPYDWNHWQASGWLEQDYYFPVKANPLSKGIAALLERLIGWAIRNGSVRPIT